MKVFSKGTFDCDVAVLSDAVLREKIEQLEKAPDISHITGLKLLRSYKTHYRIKVITDGSSYRIGAVIRGNTIWLVHFLSRKKIYQRFP